MECMASGRERERERERGREREGGREGEAERQREREVAIIPPFGVSVFQYSNVLEMKSLSIWSFSGSYFPTFGLNTDQENSEYGHFSRSILCGKINFHNTGIT